jgi:hypothetical protein
MIRIRSAILTPLLMLAAAATIPASAAPARW